MRSVQKRSLLADILPPLHHAIEWASRRPATSTGWRQSPRSRRYASGFNSAVARIGGLIATALLGFVFEQQGSTDVFAGSFRIAALIGAACAAAAACCALLLIRPPAKPAA